MEKVISNDDLMTKIFLCLPIKSLLRLKSVSKNWRSIITDPRFAALFNPDPGHVSGLLCHRYFCSNLIGWNEWADNNYPGLDFIPLDDKKSPSHDISQLGYITQIPSLSSMIIINSCNGLLLCSGYNEAEKIGGYHVLNPTTKLFETLPDPHYLNHYLNHLEGIGFAYDPSKSPHFKVVSVCSFIGSESYSFQIGIYSSETKTWTASGKIFTINDIRMYLSGGVYWNGAINWLNSAGDPMYFNIDEERVGFMPFLPMDEISNIWYGHYYFGESHGHLHFVDFYNPTTQYNVYEMRNDYSEWVFKYRVDLTPMATEYPEMLAQGVNCHCSYSIIYILRDTNSDEGSIMVLQVGGKFITYNFVDKSYKTIYGRDDYVIPEQGHLLSGAYPYIESLSSVPCTWKPGSRGQKRQGRSRTSSSYRSTRGGTRRFSG